MLRKALISACLIAAVAAIALAEWPGVVVEADEDNIVAAGIEGKWVVDEGFTIQLKGEVPGYAKYGLEFTLDDTVVKKIPAGDDSKYRKFLENRRVYAAGIMKLKDKEYPFILIALGGCPHIVYFRERDDDPMGDAESFYVMFAKGEGKGNDILFVGGDFPGESFTAFKRAK